MRGEVQALLPWRRTCLELRNDSGSRTWVSINPWNVQLHLDTGGWVRLSFESPPYGWLDLDVTPTTVFVNAWRGSECVQEMGDASGQIDTAVLPLVPALHGRAAEPPEPYATWARGLDPDRWRALLTSEVPVTVNGSAHLSEPRPLGNAWRALMATEGPDDSVTIARRDAGIAIRSGSPLLVQPLD